MLKLTIPEIQDLFVEKSQEFLTLPAVELQLEHSLVSLSKWESMFKIPFLSDTEKTNEQIFAYIEAMIISGEIPPYLRQRLTNEQILRIHDYMNDSMTATWFSDEKEKKGRGETITAELIYYWMISLNIPFECQEWHLGRLLTLIKVCNLKNAPKKKMSPAEIARRNRELNAQRRAKYNTTG